MLVDDLEQALGNPAIDETHPLGARHADVLRVPGYFVDPHVRWDPHVSAAALGYGATFWGLVTESTVETAAGDVAASRFRRVFVPRQHPIPFSWVYHDYLTIDDAVDLRRRLGPHAGLRAIREYEALGYEWIYLQADLQAGKSYWAEMEFEFTSSACRRAVHQYFSEALQALGLRIALPDPNDAEPRDYWSVGRSVPQRPRWWHLWKKVETGDTLVTLDDVLSVHHAHQHSVPNLVSTRQYWSRRPPMHLGQALLILGPAWFGKMQIGSPRARRFEEACARKVTLGARTRPNM